MNTNNIYNYNKIIIKDINEILNENIIKYKFDIYNKTTSNKIIIKNKIGKENKIRIFGDIFVKNKKTMFK